MVNPDSVRPDYRQLTIFLVKPLLDSPEQLVVSSETTLGGRRIRLRIAFDGEDKGRVFGRGGRTINAIRTLVECAGRAAEQDVNLEVYE